MSAENPDIVTGQALERREPSIMQIIDDVSKRGDVQSVEVLERLVALKLKTEEREAEKSFARDLVSLQAEIPQVNERGKIMNKGGTSVRSTYAKWEDLDAIVRPLMLKYGFSFSWTEEDMQGNMRKFSCKLLHRDGHSSITTKTMPFDKSEFRTEAQSESSTTSLARRQLMRMALNIVTKNADNDGQGKLDALTDDQIKDIETGITDSKADRVAFLKWVSEVAGVQVSDLKQVAGKHYRTIMSAIEEKKKRAAK